MQNLGGKQSNIMGNWKIENSLILRNCTPGWRSCKIAYKGRLFFYAT